MRLSTLAGSVQILCLGLISGIFIADLATATARMSLEPTAFVQLQQGVHITYSRMMPPLVIGAIAAGIVWLVLLRKQWSSAIFVFAAIALACALVAFIVTITINFPLNDLLMTWNAAAPPANVMELWNRWHQAHIVRTVLYIIAFASAVAAIGVSGRDGGANAR